jgi:uncharacterized protein YbjQ (UPF0145 family)
MISVTTPTIEGRRVTRYLGIVTGGGMLMVSASGTAVVPG